MVLLARQLYFEAVKVGDELPPLVKPPVDRAQIARLLRRHRRVRPLHVDEPSSPAPPASQRCWCRGCSPWASGELAMDWLRAHGWSASARAREDRLARRLLTSRGRVVDRRFEGRTLRGDIELWAENQRRRAGGPRRRHRAALLQREERPGSAPASRRWW